MTLTTLTKIGKGITSLFKAKGATHARELEDRFSDEINLLDYGVVADYILEDGTINPTPTDNYNTLNHLFNNVDKSKGATFLLPEGSMYCSQSLNIQYTTLNYWNHNTGSGRLSIKGKGRGSTSIYFPSTVKDGITFNKGITVISNYSLTGVSLHRLGFNQNDYSVRPFIEDHAAHTSEPLYGAGVWANRAGYMSHIEDLFISGFYTQLHYENSYGGSFSDIFNNSNGIYGFYGLGNTTVLAQNCNFRGLQACFASLGGTFTMENIVTEGTSNAFVNDTSLFGRFAGHGKVLTRGLFDMSSCYSEKLMGVARYVTDCKADEVAGVISNTMVEANYPQEIKDLINTYNPDKASIYVKNTNTVVGNVKYTVNSSSVQYYDFIVLDDVTTDSEYTTIFAIHNSLKTSGGLGNTLKNSFPKLKPSEYSILGTGTKDYKQNGGGDFVNNIAIKDRYTNSQTSVPPQFEVSRYTEAYNPSVDSKARVGYEYYIGLDGQYITRATKYNSDSSVNTSRSPWAVSSDFMSINHNVHLIANATGWNVGSAAKPWGTIYAQNTVVQPSDERLKNFIEITDKERECARHLKNLVRKFKWKAKEEDEGSGARIHYGVNAQEVIKTFELYGLDPFEYSICCYDKWCSSDEGEFKTEEGDQYGVRYTELIMFIISSL